MAEQNWARLARERYNSLLPTLGKGVERDIAGAERDILEDVIVPGTRVAEAVVPQLKTPELQPSRNFGEIFGLRTASQDAIERRVSDLTGRIFYAPPPSPTPGKIFMQQLFNELQELDPTAMAVRFKETLKTDVKSAIRYTNMIGASFDAFVSEPLFRKLVKTGNLTPEEWEIVNAHGGVLDQYEKELMLGGFTADQLRTEEEFAKTAIADAFNTADLVVKGTTAVKFGKAGIKELANVPKTLKNISDISNKKVQEEIIEEMIEKGERLTFESLSNAWSDKSKDVALNTFFRKAYAVFNPVLKNMDKMGQVDYLTNKVRKYMAPEDYERIQREKSRILEEIPLATRIIIDIGAGALYDFKPVGLDAGRKYIQDAKDIQKISSGIEAYDVFFAGDEVAEVINELSKFRDVSTNVPLDIQAKFNMVKQAKAVLEENGRTASSVDHFLEEFARWAKKPDEQTLAAIRRAEQEGTSSRLSWYSSKLDRELTPAEKLKHWFITETGEHGMVGDVGAKLDEMYQEALRLRTTGIEATQELVKESVTKVEKIKELAGRSINAGDAKGAYRVSELLQLQKSEAIGVLDSELRKLGFNLLEQDGKLIIPKAALDNPAIIRARSNVQDIGSEVKKLFAESRALGVPEDILIARTNTDLLNIRKQYNKFEDISTSVAKAPNTLKTNVAEIYDVLDDLKITIKTGVDDVLTGEKGPQFRDLLEHINTKVFDGGASQEELLSFVEAFPSREASISGLPTNTVPRFTKRMKEIAKMDRMVSNFDRQLANNLMTAPSKENIKIIKETVDQVRDIEARLPRGAFAPEHITKHRTRWGVGVTHVPLADATETVLPGWATAQAKLQRSNPVTQALTDYMIPHNPVDIYTKAMNKLEGAIEAAAPGIADKLLRDVAKIQDEGISLFPAIPGSKIRSPALGKPMITGVDWPDLNAVGKVYGIDNFGQMVKENFVNQLTESGIKPFITDRLKAAPGIGPLFDALNKQYMVTRFAINPMFHAQQIPETALFGLAKSLNLPEEMFGGYVKAVSKLPLNKLDESEEALKAILSTDLFAKVARKGEDVKVIGEFGFGDSLIQASTLEERKRLRAFIAEFPVQLRGTLHDMPALRGADPLMDAKWGPMILELQGDTNKMAQVISDASKVKEFEIWSEGIKRAVRNTNDEVQKLASYNINRSALEKDLHAIFFPFSFGKKVWSEIGNFLTTGRKSRSVISADIMKGLNDFRDEPTMMEIEAAYPQMTSWMYSLSPVNPQYPLINLSQGSIGLGGFRGTPAQAVFIDSVTGGKYDIRKDPKKAILKLGGGGAKFWTEDAWDALGEVFSQDSPEQMRSKEFQLRMLRQNKQIREFLESE